MRRLAASGGVLCLLFWGVAGCSDAAGAPDAVSRVDAELDFSAPDLSLAGCTAVDRWPAVEPRANYLRLGRVGLSYVEARGGAEDAFALLRVEDYHRTLAYPVEVEASAALRAADCEICAFVAEECGGDFARCRRFFLIQGGTVSVTRSDVGDAGEIAATVRDGLFVEWDMSRDLPRSDGRCYLVSGGELQASWGNAQP